MLISSLSLDCTGKISKWIYLEERHRGPIIKKTKELESGFLAVESRFQLKDSDPTLWQSDLDSWSQSLVGFRTPRSCIPDSKVQDCSDSTSKNFPDSGLCKQKLYPDFFRDGPLENVFLEGVGEGRRSTKNIRVRVRVRVRARAN